jgi:predicted  nucleic acid-binding Zn-ribbon protein
MPTSIDPQPAENETECARCGAIIYDQLSRCPNCGVNLYEPEDEQDGYDASAPIRRSPGLGEKISGLFHRLTGKPYKAEQVFGDALDQAELYNDLLSKLGGDHAAAERLIEHERRQAPHATRKEWLQRALQRWERDNRTPRPDPKGF